MNLHIMHNEKFNAPYIEFLEKWVTLDNHRFIYYKGISEQEIPIPDKKEILKVSNNINIISIIRVINAMNKCENIYLHGLFLRQVVIFLFFQPWLLKRCRWIVWGGDLYDFGQTDTLKRKILYYMKKYIVKNFDGYITQVSGDYEIIRNKYDGNGMLYYCFSYPSNIFKRQLDKKTTNKFKHKRIMVGNSADPSNNHLEILNNLLRYKETGIEIICPLSYGDIKYSQKVIDLGTTLFKDKFIPIIDFMSMNKYMELLSTIDIVIFNHKRQQACGNIINLLGMGKKVYIRDDITTWKFLKEHNLIGFNTNNIVNENILSDITSDVKTNNINQVMEQFSEEKLYLDWMKIFGYKKN